MADNFSVASRNLSRISAKTHLQRASRTDYKKDETDFDLNPKISLPLINKCNLSGVYV